MNTKLKKSDYIILVIFYVISAALNFLDYYNQNNELIEFLVDIPMFIVTSYIGVLIFMYFIIPKFLVEQKKYIQFAFWGLLVVLFIGIIERVVGFISGGNSWDKFPSAFNLILYSIFNGSDSIGFPLGVLLTKKFYESQTQISKIEKEQKENELKLLRSQIDPHFLFNNLNTLDSLIDSNAEKAKEYINRLSLIYRYLIQTKDAEVMELSKELQFAENYIFLIETRFGNDYEFTIEKNVNTKDKFIPTGALQALLENVVKHNKANNTPIKTRITIKNDWLTVNNSKTTNPTKDSLGTGLQNLQTRYQLLSDKKVEIKNANNTFVVSIPIIKLSEEN
ncbi:histidine kinase [Lutibacter sp. Hel_I_33_5]|uniref:sensor histidine kinase n=1 Tax=Lutibacter sp. Hel_I_33_5 TaxID=1566289 RepID=UPI0011A337D7|nr:histidine kinase [Lutibacter sp. Hel_I_33_5]TVZ56666.1 histidine kinase [Lutibacter sp. Hel_I_33_5]